MALLMCSSTTRATATGRPWRKGEPAAVTELFQTNFFGPVELIKRVLPAMREQKYGVIVNVSSIGAVVPGLGHGFGLGTGTVAEGWLDQAAAFWEAQM